VRGAQTRVVDRVLCEAEAAEQADDDSKHEKENDVHVLPPFSVGVCHKIAGKSWKTAFAIVTKWETAGVCEARGSMRARLFTDGGARGNPGPAAAAFVLQGDDGTVLDARGDAIGVQTNNVAEYTALLNGLRRAAELGVTEVEVVSDSELMVKQMRGEYRIKNAALRELSVEAARLARAVGTVTYRAVRREHNEHADRLVNEALDAEA